MTDDYKRTDQPHDKLTRLCEVMTNALEVHPDHEDVKCIIFLQDGERGGIQVHGYDGEDDSDAMVDLLVHLQALFRANGKDLRIFPIDVNQG